MKSAPVGQDLHGTAYGPRLHWHALAIWLLFTPIAITNAFAQSGTFVVPAGGSYDARSDASLTDPKIFFTPNASNELILLSNVGKAMFGSFTTHSYMNSQGVWKHEALDTRFFGNNATSGGDTWLQFIPGSDKAVITGSFADSNVFIHGAVLELDNYGRDVSNARLVDDIDPHLNTIFIHEPTLRCNSQTCLMTYNHFGLATPRTYYKLYKRANNSLSPCTGLGTLAEPLSNSYQMLMTNAVDLPTNQIGVFGLEGLDGLSLNNQTEAHYAFQKVSFGDSGCSLNLSLAQKVTLDSYPQMLSLKSSSFGSHRFWGYYSGAASSAQTAERWLATQTHDEKIARIELMKFAPDGVTNLSKQILVEPNKHITSPTIKFDAGSGLYYVFYVKVSSNDQSSPGHSIYDLCYRTATKAASSFAAETCVYTETKGVELTP